MLSGSGGGGSSSTTTTTTTTGAQGGGSSTPCAACKLLRRRCAQECPFSPYFSPHEPQKFACVHKIFGASNVSKMLMEVPENQRADAASSLVYEANARIRDPVYGCMGAISALQQQAQALQAELHAVRQEITRYRQHEPAGSSPTGHSRHVAPAAATERNTGAATTAARAKAVKSEPSPNSTTTESKDRTYWPPVIS